MTVLYKVSKKFTFVMFQVKYDPSELLNASIKSCEYLCD